MSHSNRNRPLCTHLTRSGPSPRPPLAGCAFEAGRVGECASEDEPMTLSVAEAFHIGAGFADWLRAECMSGRKECTLYLRVAVGRDPRLSGEPIVDAVRAFHHHTPTVCLTLCLVGTESDRRELAL